MVRHGYKTKDDTKATPFTHKERQLVFSHFDGQFYCYNIVNDDGNFRGFFQSHIKIHS